MMLTWWCALLPRIQYHLCSATCMGMFTIKQHHRAPTASLSCVLPFLLSNDPALSFHVWQYGLAPHSPLVQVVEFTVNEDDNSPFDSPPRRRFEQMLRKLLGLGSTRVDVRGGSSSVETQAVGHNGDGPAIMVLHHYAWHATAGDGVSAGLFYNTSEAQLGMFASVSAHVSTHVVRQTVHNTGRCSLLLALRPPLFHCSCVNPKSLTLLPLDPLSPRSSMTFPKSPCALLCGH